MTSDAIVPIIVAALGALAAVAAALLTRRTAQDQSHDSRLGVEVNYLSERLDAERRRTDGLEDEVRQCHEERDQDRRRFAAELEQMRETIGVLMKKVDP